MAGGAEHDLARGELIGSVVLVVIGVALLAGKKRFKAYGTVFDALQARGCFVIGDLFPRGEADIDQFRESSTLDELCEGSYGCWDYKRKVLRKN